MCCGRIFLFLFRRCVRKGIQILHSPNSVYTERFRTDTRPHAGGIHADINRMRIRQRRDDGGPARVCTLKKCRCDEAFVLKDATVGEAQPRSPAPCQCRATHFFMGRAFGCARANKIGRRAGSAATSEISPRERGTGNVYSEHDTGFENLHSQMSAVYS